MGVCRWFVVNPTITVRLSEEELRRLDELAQRMGVTRSDVIRSLVNNFDEALKQEVDRERKRWMAIGFVGALESAILDPEVIVRFVRRNVDVLGYPDFLIGMVRVRNRVVVFSHHDKIGSQLLSLVRSRVEEDVKREEAEIEQEDDGDEDSEAGRATPMRIRASGPVKPNTVRVAPVVTNHKLVSSNKAMPPILRSIAARAVDRVVANNGGRGTKVAGVAAVPENKKLVVTGIPATNNSAAPQIEGSNPQAVVGTNPGGPAGPVDGGSMDKPAGDFVFALVANLYHKHRDKLLKLVESRVGD
jgi:predicted transcriptional regulator